MFSRHFCSLLLGKEHRRLQPCGRSLHLAGGVQLVLLGVGLLHERGGFLQLLLGRLHVDVLGLLEVIDQHGELVGVDGGEAAQHHQGLPGAILLVAQHPGVQGRHHGRVVRQDAKLPGGGGQDRLRAGHGDAVALRGQDLELQAVSLGRHVLLHLLLLALLGAAKHRGAAGRGPRPHEAQGRAPGKQCQSPEEEQSDRWRAGHGDRSFTS
mmetsp:Transcript_125203/g.297110  ORF Transcript_125203/g.297110 Transcript_125203/m.297110 type:complete len:210 (-) Transcript_125203:31-660(-)